MSKFPAWLTRDPDKGAFIVDSHAAYPLAIAAIVKQHNDAADQLDAAADKDKSAKVKPLSRMNAEELDQYMLECAYQCIKMTVQELVEESDEDPRAEGKSLVIMFQSGEDKQKWAQASYPAGRGADAATKGREARLFKAKVKGALLA